MLQKTTIFLLVIFAKYTVHQATTTTRQPTTTTAPPQGNYVCICDTTTEVVPGETCYIASNGSSTSINGCRCGTGADPKATMTNGVWVVYCGTSFEGNYSAATTTTTTTTITTSIFCVDLNNNGICDDVDPAIIMRCTTTGLDDSTWNIFKIVYIVFCIYIIVCVIATIIVNFMHKNSGHHRWLHFLEELGFVGLWITMMGLQFFLADQSGPCEILKVVTHFFMVLVSGLFAMEAIFANSMINNQSTKNGMIPAFANYIIPFVIAIIVVLVAYFTNKEEYKANGLHCFAATTGEVLWAYIIPPWILLTIAGYKCQTAFLQCRKFTDSSDEQQIYWAYRSARALPPFAWLLFGIYCTVMFGLDQQIYWVLILTVIMTIVYGPAIFVVHTYCHLNTSKAFHPKFMGFYTPCPEEKRPSSPSSDDDPLTESVPLDETPPAEQSPTEPSANPTEEAPPPKDGSNPKPQNGANPKKDPPATKPEGTSTHAPSQNFYDWLTDPRINGDLKDQSRTILFKPRT